MSGRSAEIAPVTVGCPVGFWHRALTRLGAVLGHMLWLGALVYLLVASGLHLLWLLGF